MKAAVQQQIQQPHRPTSTSYDRRRPPICANGRDRPPRHSFTPRRSGHFLSSQVVPWTYEAKIPYEPSGSWRQSLQQVVGVLTLIGTLAAQYLARHAISRDAGKTLDSILLEGPS